MKIYCKALVLMAVISACLLPALAQSTSGVGSQSIQPSPDSWVLIIPPGPLPHCLGLSSSANPTPSFPVSAKDGVIQRSTCEFDTVGSRSPRLPCTVCRAFGLCSFACRESATCETELFGSRSIAFSRALPRFMTLLARHRILFTSPRILSSLFSAYLLRSWSSHWEPRARKCQLAAPC